MQKTIRTYLVSFGNSSVYRYVYECDGPFDTKRNSLPFEHIEKELEEFLRKNFPARRSFAYFTTPKVTELSAANAHEADGYEPLDAAAIETIKQTLLTDVRNYNVQSELDLNAPFANVQKDNGEQTCTPTTCPRQ